MTRNAATVVAEPTVEPLVVTNDECDQPLLRAGVVTAVVVDLLLLLAGATALNWDLKLWEGRTAIFEVTVLGGIALTLPFIETKMKADRPAQLLVLGLALVVVAKTLMVSGTSDMTVLLPAIRQSLLVVLPIYSLGYALPRILSRRNYLALFSILLGVFSLHTLLTIWLCATGTQTLFGIDLARTEGRAPLMFGKVGSLVTGLFWNVNNLATSLMLLPAVALLVENMVSSRLAKLAARISQVLLSLHVFATLSRAGILTLSASYGLFTLLAKRFPRPLKVISICFFTAAGLFLLHQFAGMNTEKSMVERAQIWTRHLNDISANPWGYGLPKIGNEYMPHNVLIGMMLYFGPVAVALLLGLLARFIFFARQQVQNGTASHLLFIAVLLTIVLHGSVEFMICCPGSFANSLFWLLLGYLAYHGNDTVRDTGTNS